jgi:acetyl-CoA hydrolase/succinyl-CoA:acetate CoA-transferase
MDATRIPSSLRDKVVNPSDVIQYIPKAGVVAFSGMAGMALAKEVPSVISQLDGSYNLTVLAGGTTTVQFEEELAAVKINRRYPVISGGPIRDKTNSGLVHVFDYWISEYSRLLRSGGIPQAQEIDVAIVESSGIVEGGIIPSTSVDAMPAMVETAKRVIVEVNLSKPVLYGLHDILLPHGNGSVLINDILDRVGRPVVECHTEKIAAIVVTDKHERGAGGYGGVSKNELAIAGQIDDLFSCKLGRKSLSQKYAIQPGAGPLASALLDGLDVTGLRVWCEAISVDWVRNIGDKVRAISSSCIYSLKGQEKILREVYDEIDSLKEGLVLRPYEITNRAELIARMNLISIQQAIEVDIYGNANITHIGGKLYNGVGGSGDFMRNAFLTILALPSTTSDRRIPRIVPICSHVDIPEHDVDFLVTENGWADLRGLSPRERAKIIIERCVAGNFKDALTTYFEKACKTGGHEPISWKAVLEFYQTIGLE